MNSTIGANVLVQRVESVQNSLVQAEQQMQRDIFNAKQNFTDNMQSLELFVDSALTSVNENMQIQQQDFQAVVAIVGANSTAALSEMKSDAISAKNDYYK